MRHKKNIKENNSKVIKLDNKINIVNDGVIDNVVSLFDEYEKERNTSDKYNIIVNLDLFSLLNGIDGSFFDTGSEYITLYDLGNPYSTSSYRKLKDLFDVYLVSPNILENIEENKYMVKGTVLQKIEDITFASFSKNEFNDRKYLITINDISFDEKIDSLTNHINDLFLYFHYKNKTRETIGSEYLDNGEVIIGERPLFNGDIGETIDLGYKFWNPKDNVYYGEYIFNHILFFNYTHSLGELSVLSYLIEPVVKIELFNYGKAFRYKEKTVDNKKIKLPEFAKFNNGVYSWTEINKINFPYMNKTSYVFYDKILHITPNMNHENTSEVYNELIIEDSSQFFQNQDPYKNFNSPC